MPPNWEREAVAWGDTPPFSIRFRKECANSLDSKMSPFPPSPLTRGCSTGEEPWNIKAPPPDFQPPQSGRRADPGL